MDEKFGKSLDVILAHSSRHCLQFRLADYDFSSIPHAELRRVASSMLDYFEREMERLDGDHGSEGSASTGKGTGDALPSSVTRQRQFRLR